MSIITLVIGVANMNDPRGSLWNKWDLHVHTPDSLVNEYGGNSEDSWEKFIKELESLPPEFKVIGINDYNFIDGFKRIREAKLLKGRLQNLDLILPVVELRLDKFGGTDGNLSRVNFHVIFSDRLDPAIIQSQFLNAITAKYNLTSKYAKKGIRWSGIVTKESLKDLGEAIIQSVPPGERSNFESPLKEGFNNLNISIEKIFEILNSSYFEGNFITAVGKTEWANIKWNDHSIAEKKDIINNADLVFISSESIEAFYKAKESLKTAEVNDILLDCSDAHNFTEASCKDRIGKCFTWIKADTTFEGLKQVLNEPNDRIFVGIEPLKLRLVRDNKTKYIKSVRIYKKETARLEEAWFNNELSFNHGLISVIGNKGMGKSALTDVIALLGNSSCQDFSFLNKNKFRNPTNNKSLEFEAIITWESDEEPVVRCLADSVPAHEIERVKYIPQKYFEGICNENEVEEGSDFDKELKKVIFSHVDVPNRLDCSSLDELIDYKTDEINDFLSTLRQELGRINEEIIKLENLTSEDYRGDLKKQLEGKQSELEIHESNKPPEVTKPTKTPEVEERIKDLRSKIAELSSSISQTNDQISNSVKILASVEKIRDKITHLSRTYDLFSKEYEDEFKNIGIQPNSIIKLVIDNSSIDQVEERHKIKLQENKSSLRELSNDKEATESQLITLQSSLDLANKAYQNYLDLLDQWTKKKDEIIGNSHQLNSLNYYNNLLNESNTINLDNLEKKKIERVDKVKEIYYQIKRLVDIYIELYRPVQDFIDGHKLMDTYQLTFNVSIIQIGFIDNFLAFINQGAKGTFHGVLEGEEKLIEILDKYDFNEEINVLSFLDEIIDNLEKDKRDLSSTPIKIGNQLRKNKGQRELFNFLFSLEYIKPKYILQLGGKELLQLSPGERGILLLIFYLLVDRDDCPLIIDQPEDNLDNQSVYEIVAPCIREAKSKRQVFIITHNPNLAVVCDAEQIIAASIDKSNKEKVNYISGSIENPTINKRIIDILEGTQPAFKKRESKYFLKK